MGVSCTKKKAEHRRIDAFELWCWRRLLRVPWTARRSNQSILNRLLITLFLSLVYHRYSCYVIEGKNKLLSNTYMFISSVAQSCPTLQPHGLQHARLPCPSPTSRACSCPSTHVHRLSDALQPSHSLSSPSPPAFNLFQHQGLFQ